jgi:DNA polymerase-4
VAKVASDQDKPDGLTVIAPSDQLDFIATLPIEAFHGIGPVTAEAMHDLGIETGADLQATDARTLRHHFGARGAHFKTLAMGEDDRPVQPDRERKSVGAERTFETDLEAPAAMLDRLRPLAERVAERLQGAGQRGRTVTLKIKDHRHNISSRQQTLDRTVGTAEELLRWAERLLHRPHPPPEPVRLLGLSVSSLAAAEEAGTQLALPFAATG